MLAPLGLGFSLTGKRTVALGISASDSSRPTAVNLSWALKRMDAVAVKAGREEHKTVAKVKEILHDEALQIRAEDVEVCRKIGELGLELVKPGDGILTHCNAGQLATVKYGTATAPIYLGQERGYNFHVFADETRPLLQGARLTALELRSAGVDVTLICDNMSASVMSKGWVQAVFVGCDRVAANGDTANKIGTSVVAGSVIAYMGMTMTTSDNFRIRRILSWLHPEANMSSGGYQVLQGLYAIGSGGFFGKGLGNSAQKLGTIPEAQNDMIFSIVCEELGVFGAALLLLMFGYLLYRLFFIAQNAPDLYGTLVVTGIFVHIALQVILNLCVVLNLMPTTGITLPFVSYGGTSILFLMAEMGIALSVSGRIQTTGEDITEAETA